MPLDPAQRYQSEQDAITAAWEAERLTTCDAAIALLRNDDCDVIIGADADGHTGSMSRLKAFLVQHDQ